MQSTTANAGDICALAPLKPARLPAAAPQPAVDAANVITLPAPDATFLRDGSRSGYGCTDTRLEMEGVCNQFIISRADNRIEARGKRVSAC